MKNSSCLLSLLLCLCTVSFSSCENKKRVSNANQEAANPREIPVIKIEPPDESDLKPLLLSEFADSISYVKMDTDPSYFVSSPWAVQTDAGYIFRGEMFHFSKEGKFLCRIGKSGRGPGEYITPSAMGVDPKNKIVYVRGSGMIHSLLKYSLTDGKYMGTLKKDFVSDAMMIKGMDDALVMAYTAQDKNKPIFGSVQDVILYNTALDSVMDSRTFDYHITASPMHHDFSSSRILTSCRDKIYYKNAFTDTLYSITKEKITPCMIIDMGKHKLPVDYIYGNEPFENIVLIYTILIAGDHIFMHCTHYSIYGKGSYGKSSRFSFLYICDLNGNNGSYYESMFTNDLDNGPNYSLPIRGDVSIIDVGEVDGEMKDYYLPNNKMEKKMKDKDRFKRLYEASNPVEDNPIVRTIHWKK